MKKKSIMVALFSGYLILMAWLGVLLVSRYQYRDGVKAYQLEQYDEAFEHLNGAFGVFPQDVAALLAPRDLFRIRTALGKTLYKQAMAAWKKQEIAEKRELKLSRVYDLMEKAHGFLAAAVAHDPLSYRTVFWFARVTNSLEILFPIVYGRQVVLPFNALPLFRQAAAFRPAGITVRYYLARYFYRHRRMDDLGDTVENIGRIYPSAHGYLKKQPWFDTTIRERFQQGCLLPWTREHPPGERFPSCLAWPWPMVIWREPSTITAGAWCITLPQTAPGSGIIWQDYT